MKLHYKRFGEGKPLIVLHGLLGMLDNWQTPAKKLAEHFDVILVDQRNHGRSPHSDEFDYQAMADDLEELVEDLNLEKVLLLGHSMGGKTAMKYAQQHPEKVEKLVVADMAPKAYPVHHEMILKGLAAVDLEKIKSRGEAEEVLKEYIPDWGVRQFLLKNLYWKEKGKLAWRFNLSAIKENIEKMGEAMEATVFNKPVLFVRGGKSNYITDNDMSDIKKIFPLAELNTIEGAGHWLHAEKPDEFLEVVVDILKK